MRSFRAARLLPGFASVVVVGACTISFGEPVYVGVGGGGGIGPPASCGETAACPLSQPCLATVDNHGSPQFGLRFAELSVRPPAALAEGFLRSYLNQCFWPSLPACFPPDALRAGDGTTSWLLRFDLTQSTLTLGGAAMPADPAQGYAFLDAMVAQGGQMRHVAPVTFDLVTNQDGSFGVATALDVDLPMFFPVPGPMVALPLHGLTASHVVVSSSHDCIGSYDPAIFDPEAQCQPSVSMTSYVHGGRLDAYLSLEEADGIDMGLLLGETLCVVLSEDVDQFGDNATPVVHCARTNGVIDFKGDWCSSTNALATASCADAVHLTADFAASAVVIHD